MKKKIIEYGAVLLLALAFTLNYEMFVYPNTFAPAGLNGMATMVQYKLGFSVGYMNLLLNVPLCIAAWFILKRDYTVKTTLFIIAFSAFTLIFKYRLIDLTPFIYYTNTGTSTVLAPVTAGVINGAIYGFIVKLNGSTGGTDVIAGFIHHKHPEKNLMTIIFVINAFVAGASYFVYDYKFEPVICCIIYSYITSEVSDRIIRGRKSQVKFEIVTTDYEAISADIINETRHSATVMPAKGMYSGKETDLLVCVVNKHQVVKLQEIISRYPGSFAYISPVSETFGNYDLKGAKKKKFL